MINSSFMSASHATTAIVPRRPGTRAPNVAVDARLELGSHDVDDADEESVHGLAGAREAPGDGHGVRTHVLRAHDGRRQVLLLQIQGPRETPTRGQAVFHCVQRQERVLWKTIRSWDAPNPTRLHETGEHCDRFRPSVTIARRRVCNGSIRHRNTRVPHCSDYAILYINHTGNTTTWHNHCTANKEERRPYLTLLVPQDGHGGGDGVRLGRHRQARGRLVRDGEVRMLLHLHLHLGALPPLPLHCNSQ